jgi:phosphoglucomutase
MADQGNQAGPADPAVIERARYWATAPVFDETTRKEITTLLERSDTKELTERFYRDLEFGTGGLRGILGAGTSRMNIYNVRKATTALAQHLAATFPGESLKVAISHDSRRFSRDFAKATAEVLAGHGIQALITKDLRPVPMLSFMVRHFQCHAGVCVTASHNPPNYNGYKVYWRTGGQLVPPHDEAIIRRYGAISGYEGVKSVPYTQALVKGLVKEIGAELDEPYFAKVTALSLRSEGRQGLKIVYTPLHGSGLYPVTEMLKRFGFTDVTVVPEQEQPDGFFPTVKSPNPENPAALDMARDLAVKIGADLILATDPDCDRIGMEVRVGQHFFRPNGNQIGALLNEYVLAGMKEKGRLPASPLVIKTVVTTDLQADVAKEFGALCEETLTGFKWICQLIEDYDTGARKPARTFACGGEESYGFLAGSFVRDKDAVISCCLAAEMVAYYKSKSISVIDALDSLFQRHGVYHETLADLTLPGKEGAEQIAAMMARLRQSPPRVIDGIPVQKLRDFATGQELAAGEGGFTAAGTIPLPKSNVLQFILNDGTKISVRPSGTEPKIKFYVSVKDPQGIGKRGDALDAIKTRSEARAKRIEDIFVAMAKS